MVLFKYFKSPDCMLEIDNVFSLVFCELLILDNLSVHCDNGVSWLRLEASVISSRYPSWGRDTMADTRLFLPAAALPGLLYGVCFALCEYWLHLNSEWKFTHEDGFYLFDNKKLYLFENLSYWDGRKRKRPSRFLVHSPSGLYDWGWARL